MKPNLEEVDEWEGRKWTENRDFFKGVCHSFSFQIAWRNAQHFHTAVTHGTLRKSRGQLSPEKDK